MLKANFEIYLIVIIAAIVLPLIIPGLFHTDEELAPYTSKRSLFEHLLWRDSFNFLVIGLIISTIIIALGNITSRFMLSIYFVGGLVSLIIWGFIYIYFLKRRK